MEIIKVSDQATGRFNGGEILEHKPIGFPQDGGTTKPYSNLFYWAHAWTDVGSTIGEHPHKGFEIMSFVLEGEIEHYDSQQRGWSKLPTGSAQVIRSGSGISHAEKMHKGAHMFQIWLDPDLSKTINQPASYDDYMPDSFSVENDEGMTVKTYAGEGGPMKLDTPGIEIKEIGFNLGKHQLQLNDDKIHSMVLLRGTLELDSYKMEKGDFAIIDDKPEIEVNVVEESGLFIISSPKIVNYTTYG